MRSRPIAAMLAATTAALASVAHAEPAPLQGRVSLSASATVEVTKDLLKRRAQHEQGRQGTPPACRASSNRRSTQRWPKRANAAKPGQIEVQTGNFASTCHVRPRAG